MEKFNWEIFEQDQIDFADVSNLIDNKVDAKGKPLTNKMEKLLREELGRLYIKRFGLLGRI